jgi:hypothetical protein
MIGALHLDPPTDAFSEACKYAAAGNPPGITDIVLIRIGDETKSIISKLKK